MGDARKDELVRKGILDGSQAFAGPYGIQIGITDSCNYRCEFCERFSYRKPDEQADNGSYKIDKEKFLSLVDSAAALDVEQISIVGIGEPFLHPDLTLFIRKIKENSIRCMVTTNGSLLNEKNCQEIVECGLDILNVSVNAATEQTYERVHGKGRGKNLAKIIGGLSRLSILKSGTGKPWINVRFLVTRANMGEVADFVGMAVSLGADEITFQHYMPHQFALDQQLNDSEKREVAETLRNVKGKADGAGTKSNIEFFVSRYSGEESASGDYEGFLIDDDFYRRHPCYTGWTYAMVLEDGSVRPCCYCCVPLGNINEKPFDKIWFGETYNLFRENTINLPKLKDDLKGCACFFGCGSVRDTIRTAQRLDLAPATT